MEGGRGMEGGRETEREGGIVRVREIERGRKRESGNY